MAASAHRVCQTPLKSGSVMGHRRAEEEDQSPTAGGQTWTLSVPMASRRTKQARNKVSRSTGRFWMVPLRSPLICPPAESLRGSRASNSAFRAKSGARVDWYAGTWNVRSLLDNEGSIETAIQGSERDGNEDRRIDLVLRELGRYGIKVAALQETQWFGNAEYHVGRSVVLSAGRSTPGTGQPRQRGEGVAIVLTGEAVTAWKAGGEQWKARSLWLITAKLKHGDRHQDILHVISCYAPTFAANRTEKNKFFNDLQQALDEIPPEEPYLLLGTSMLEWVLGVEQMTNGNTPEGHTDLLRPMKLAKNCSPSSPLMKRLYATPGSPNETSTSKPGSTPNRRDGIALTLPLYAREIEGGAWMQLSNEEQNATQTTSCSGSS